MALAKAKFEDEGGETKLSGTVQLTINEIKCICGHCRLHCTENGTVELDFMTKKIYYYCGQCKKMNEIDFTGGKVGSLPKTRFGR